IQTLTRSTSLFLNWNLLRGCAIMDGGGSIQSNERAAEKLMDDYLKSIGLHRKKIAKDGSCLFRAVAEQVLHCQSHHTEVRARCVAFLKENRELYEAFVEGDFEEYLCKLQDPQQWVGEVEINALAIMYKRDFLIFQEPGKPAVNITDNNFKDKVQLCFMNGNHYDSVYPISRVKNAGMCQWSWAAWPSASREAQQKMDYCIAAGMQFAAGDQCQVCVGHFCCSDRPKILFEDLSSRGIARWDCLQVRLDGSGRSYSATVKEVPPDNGPVTVLIEELGRKQVPLWNLRPASDESSWRTVGGRDKKLSNGHGEWEERGKGRGRGKHMPGSSSASQVAAGGSSGRGQKHHFGPPQSPKEEQGGGKSSRRATSSAEPAFGLTEEQRLAREEEEINVALVEIQLRDEHSFPALGTQPRAQNEASRRKSGEKLKFFRNKTTTPPSSVVRHAARVHDGPPITTQSPDVGAAPVASQTKPELLPSGPVQSLVEKGSQAVVPGDQPLAPRSPSSVPDSRLPHRQQGPDSNPEVDAAPQIPPPVTGQAPETPTQPDVAQVQDLHSSDDDVCPPAQLHQPPHPSQVPPPSFPLPDVPDHPRNPSAHTQAEESLSPTQPQPEPPAPPALQPHPPQHPHLPSVPPHFQSIPGGVPLHQLSQIYQDPLYPGFPQNEKGGMAVTPPYSSNKSGDDMPRGKHQRDFEPSPPSVTRGNTENVSSSADINILRFFFNLGIKAYSMPMFAPYIYLFPLQHAHTLQVHSQSSAPSYPPSTPPARPQELYPRPQYPPASSVPPQYDQPAATESSQVGEVYSQPTYHATDAPPQRTSGPTHAWEQHQIPPPTSSSFPGGYPTPTQPYPHPRHFPQDYHPVPGLQQYPPGAPPYGPSSVGYQSPPAHEELQVNQGAPEQQQPQPQQPQQPQQQQQHQSPSPSGDSSPHVHTTTAPKMANISSSSSSRAVVLPGYRKSLLDTSKIFLFATKCLFSILFVFLCFHQQIALQHQITFCFSSAVKIESRENLTGAVLLLVPNSGVKDVTISRTTMNPNSTPTFADNNLSHGYRGHQEMLSAANAYSLPGASETAQVGFLASMAEPMSIGCSTEEDWEEKDSKPAPSHYRGPRRSFRGGGRWRGSHDSGRGANRRRQASDPAVGMNFFHYSYSPRGRGRERGY
ncbi:unnamed protein product, partial [Tetraodon nigroviridis]